MKSTICFWKTVIFCLLPLVWAQDAIAAPLAQPSPLSPAQINRLSGGLYRFNSQDFFNRGQRQLEQEVQLIQQKKLFFSEGVLQINQQLQIPPDLSEFERPSAKLRLEK